MKNSKGYQKRQASYYMEIYKTSGNRRLSDIYNSDSDAKKEAFDHCMELKKELNGDDLKILTFNVNFFTAGFTFWDKDEKKKKFMAITASYEAVIDFE